MSVGIVRARDDSCNNAIAGQLVRWAWGEPQRTDGLCPATASPPYAVGASHEAEGRRGARDGGAGWVRAPAGRLRLLRQILNELVAGLEQFLLVDDVVAVEDGAGGSRVLPR